MTFKDPMRPPPARRFSPRSFFLGVMVGLLLALIAVGIVLWNENHRAPRVAASPTFDSNGPDVDGDFFTDSAEIAAGTNPGDSTHYPGSHAYVLTARYAILAHTIFEERFLDKRRVAASLWKGRELVYAADLSRITGLKAACDIAPGEFITDSMVYASPQAIPAP